MKISNVLPSPHLRHPPSPQGQTQYGRLKSINLLGAAGMGKSAVAGGLFWLMKAHLMSVGQVTEYAKHLIHCGYTNEELHEAQERILEEQTLRQRVLSGKYEYAITDSPLLFCAFYSGAAYDSAFDKAVASNFAEFDNINFFLSRDLSGDAHFEQAGRMQTKEMSIRNELEMLDFLDDRDIEFIRLPITMRTPWLILEHIAPGLAKCPVF